MKNNYFTICILFFLCTFYVGQGEPPQIPLDDSSSPDGITEIPLNESITPIIWIHTYGGRGRDICWSLKHAQEDNYVLAGETSTYGSGGGDMWLLKIDSHGNEIWNQTYGGNRGDYAFDVTQTTDTGYILAGGTKSYSRGDHDTWLVKTDAQGRELWNKSYGGTERDQGYAVVETNDQGYAICGGSGSFTQGPNDYWIIKTNSHGDEYWNLTYGTLGYDWGYDIIETDNNALVFTGGTDTSRDQSHILDIGLIKITEDGDLIWDTWYNKFPARHRWDEGYEILKVSDGYIIAGIAHTYHWAEDGEGDGWLIKTNKQGDLLWEKTYGGRLCDGFSSIQPTPDDGYIISGWTYSYGNGDADIWVLKTDSKGQVEWDCTLGQAEYEWSMLHTVLATDDGCYLVAGTTKSYNTRGNDAVVAKIKKPFLSFDFMDGWGCSFKINNNGNTTMNALNYTIDITGSILLASNTQGTIGSINPGQQMVISIDGMLGFGTACIRLSIGDIGKTVPCMLIGPLVIAQ